MSATFINTMFEFNYNKSSYHFSVSTNSDHEGCSEMCGVWSVCVTSTDCPYARGSNRV